MATDIGSFVARYGARTITYAVGLGLALLLILIGLASCATTVPNTEVALVVNNITGTITPYANGGMVLHLPFGLSSVYMVDKAQKSMHLARGIPTGEHPQGDQVRIKTNDGSNVEADIEVAYQIDVNNAYIAYRELVESKSVSEARERDIGRATRDEETNMEQILRAVIRSEVRNELGTLDTAEIIDPVSRNQKLHIVQDKLSEYFKSMGVEIVSVNAQNFHFNEDYESIVQQRKSAEQILTNQADFQKSAQKKRERMAAEANKDKSNAKAQLQGELNKRLLTAQGEAKRLLTKAAQEAYQSDREGEIALANAVQEAAAIKTEGEQKAQAMEKLFEAYEKGGEGLVREALVKLYEGATVSAKPYSASDRIDQIRAVPFQVDSTPVQTPRPNTPVKGGSSGR